MTYKVTLTLTEEYADMPALIYEIHQAEDLAVGYKFDENEQVMTARKPTSITFEVTGIGAQPDGTQYTITMPE